MVLKTVCGGQINSVPSALWFCTVSYFFRAIVFTGNIWVFVAECVHWRELIFKTGECPRITLFFSGIAVIFLLVTLQVTDRFSKSGEMCLSDPLTRITYFCIDFVRLKTKYENRRPTNIKTSSLLLKFILHISGRVTPVIPIIIPKEYLQSPISVSLIFVKQLQHWETVSLLKEMSKIVWCFTSLIFTSEDNSFL